uniref:Uncharacterized protein n=1 Tax=Strigops habroptila TaxID=2489341 RepID=A0A672TIA4_STRHB
MGCGQWYEKAWDYLEASGLSDFLRPVHRRIPHFKGASHAATRLLGLQEFKAAKTVKINPDAPQKNAQFLITWRHCMVKQCGFSGGIFTSP